MRSLSPSSLLVVLLLVAAGVPSSLGDAASVHQRPDGDGQHGGRRKNAPAADRDAFCQKVGTFAVWVYCLWNDIKPVAKLESVLSASTRPAEGGKVDYLLVLRVAKLGTFRALVRGVPSEGSEDWKLMYFEPVVGA